MKIRKKMLKCLWLKHHFGQNVSDRNVFGKNFFFPNISCPKAQWPKYLCPNCETTTYSITLSFKGQHRDNKFSSVMRVMTKRQLKIPH